jgi:polyhydroxyalkanoate synthesis repressor PhaR
MPFEEQALSKPRVIKRYANRKLYDTEESKYITLGDVAQLLELGTDVQILDNDTNEDITGLTLAQLLLDAQRKKRRNLPLSSLKQLVQSGGDILQRRISHPVNSIRDEAEERMARIKDEAGRQIRTIKERTKIDDVQASFQELFQQTQQNLEDLQKKFEDRYRQLLKSNDSNNEGQTAEERLAVLEARLSVIEEALFGTSIKKKKTEKKSGTKRKVKKK